MKRSKKEDNLQEVPNIKAVQTLIAKAVSDLSQGNSGHYKKLVPAFGKILERNSGEDLMIWFSAFAKLANTLPLHQDALSELLDLILSFRWFAPNSRHAEVLAAYADLLVQAVAGNKGIVSRVLLTLTKQIRCKKSAVGEPDMHTTQETVQALHSCLKRLLHMMPAAGQALFRALEASYPSKYDDRTDQLVYLEAALTVSSYCVESSRGVLDLVMRHLLQLDADIDLQVALGDEQLTFALEANNTEDSFAKERTKEEKIKADTMDALMEKMFDFVDRQHLEDVTFTGPLSAFPPEFAKQAEFFRDLLHVFNARVLTSPKAQFVQYLVFYACSKNPAVFAPIFLQFLMSVFRDFSLDHQIRAAAAAYIASFLARFGRLQPEAIASSLSTVAAWGVEYVARHESAKVSQLPDLKTHYLFYVVCNCMFYVLCYRASTAPASLKPALKSVLGCSLNPLLFVLSGVRDELLDIAEVDRVLDVESVRARLQDNRKLLVASNVEFSMEFPFDPYLLPRGERRLAVVYNHWRGHDDDNNHDDDDENDDDDDQRPASESSLSGSEISSDGSDESDYSDSCVAMSLGNTPVFSSLTGTSLHELQRGGELLQSVSSGNSPSFIC